MRRYHYLNRYKLSSGVRTHGLNYRDMNWALHSDSQVENNCISSLYNLHVYLLKIYISFAGSFNRMQYSPGGKFLWKNTWYLFMTSK